MHGNEKKAPPFRYPSLIDFGRAEPQNKSQTHLRYLRDLVIIAGSNSYKHILQLNFYNQPYPFPTAKKIVIKISRSHVLL